MMNCNIIKDLLPSYIDGICSQETADMVKEHLMKCEDCQKTKENMTSPPPAIPVPIDNLKKAKDPFRIIKRQKTIQISIAVLATAFIIITFALMVQNVGVLHDFFFPQRWIMTDFSEDEYFEFDSIFFRKKITNPANNEEDIVIRVKDTNDVILIDNLLIPSGESTSLNILEQNTKYIIEAISTTETYTLVIY